MAEQPVRKNLTIQQAADYLGVSTATVRRYIASGRITGYRTGPRLIRIDRRDLDELLRPIPTVERGRIAI